MPTQAALYGHVDLELSWSEEELPERERTKHVHRLHPYLGKFVPQLAQTFLERYAQPGQLVWDPFVGSGTTLVEANAFGAHAAGCDISAFNCLLSRVKTAAYDPGALCADAHSLSAPPTSGGLTPRDVPGSTRPRPSGVTAGADASTRVNAAGDAASSRAMPRGLTPGHGFLWTRLGTPYLERWFAPDALADLLAFRERIASTSYADLWRVVLSRAARSARLARHDDLDFPREPVAGPYFCHKHRRTCRAVAEAEKFLRRYVRDAVRRVEQFSEVRTDAAVTILHGDARRLDPPAPVDLVLTSPPYPGLIDYHEQHAYAFELLGIERRDDDEIGRTVKGYCEDVAAVLDRAARALRPGGRVVVVVNDSRGLYEQILESAGLRLEERATRHVNRRTGRRNGEYYEDVLIATP